VATFMAKWNSKLPGSGGHLHQSLWDKGNHTNLFFDEKQAHNISNLMKSYIAGQLKCLPEILPLLAPNPNSYKRLCGGDWAPSTLTWGIDNRTCAVRAITGNPEATRLELRVPGADTNAYLAMAASLAAGLYGIKNQLPLNIEAVKGNGYRETKNGVLPATLEEATQKMKQSAIARKLLGDAFVEHFTQTREWECSQQDPSNSNWELERYLEII